MFDPVELFCRRAVDRLLTKTQGWLPEPTDEEGWILLCGVEEVVASRQPRQFCPAGFEAHTVYHELHQIWFILYNMDVPVGRRCEFIAHELIEFVTEIEYTVLYPGKPPDWMWEIDGVEEEKDFFHFVARRGVEVCCRQARWAATGTPIDELKATGIFRSAADIFHAARARHTPVPGVRKSVSEPKPLPPVTASPNRLHWPSQSGICTCGCQDLAPEMYEDM